MQSLILGCAIVATIALAGTAWAQGRVGFEGPVAAPQTGTNRFVRVYLPPAYDAQPGKRFPVLYVHDGQNAFTTVGTNVAFGWGNWELDRTVARLVGERRMQEIILVAVDGTPQRYVDYRGRAGPPAPDTSTASPQPVPAPGDDAAFLRYSRFLIDEL